MSHSIFNYVLVILEGVFLGRMNVILLLNLSFEPFQKFNNDESVSWI